MGKSARLTLVLCLASCSADHSNDPPTSPPPATAVRIQRNPTVEIAYPESSKPLSSLPRAKARSEERAEVELPSPVRASATRAVDSVLQSVLLPPLLPPTILSFAGQAGTLGVAPPDANGAVGPNHYVQAVNLNIEIWNKSGTVLSASRATRTLWTGYTGTNAGNGCSTRNDGDAVVLYDQLADRWFITQFSLPNTGTTGGPSFQCVAVSKTADPTGAYWLYDFRYNVSINDQMKFSVWPDAYYVAFNAFQHDPTLQFAFVGADICAYDRISMLQGSPATQVCFQQTTDAFGVLPANVDGKILPPRGEPGFLIGLGLDSALNFDNTLDFWKFHVDFGTPANSTLTGPTSLAVSSYGALCLTGTQTGSCVPEPGGSLLESLGDRLMFRLSYRNFGTHESLIANHSVEANSAGGLRWYEIRSPNGTPTIFQQGTYAPNDGKWRWMGTMAQDQAQDMALGFSISSTTSDPSIAWTGRLVTDGTGMMGQGEGTLVTGTGIQSGGGRWGDFTSMWVDPSDDCTFWYTNEYYATTGSTNWQTRILSFKFPNCAANDFSISVSPSSQTVNQNGSVNYTVTTASTAGTAESITLNIQDLPTGVTGSFNPNPVPAGSPSTLTVSAALTAPVSNSPQTFTVIGKAASAVHAATAQVMVASCPALTTCPNGDDCGTVDDGCGGQLPCGTCGSNQVCVSNHCIQLPDAGVPDAPAIDAPAIDAPEFDAVVTVDAAGTGGAGGTAGAGGSGGTGGTAGSGGAGGSAGTSGSGGASGSGGTPGASDSGGCGCSMHGSPRDASLLSVLVGLGALSRRRRKP